MSGWGTGWGNSQEWIDKVNEEFDKEFPIHIGIDPAKPGSDKSHYFIHNTDGTVKEISEEEYLNKFKNIAPAHDPYTNPNAHIYYECGCGAILDPGTKSFAQLNNHASEAGWKIRWGADSYVPYCVKCGEEVE